MVSLDQAKELINLARDSIKSGFSGNKPRVNSKLKSEFSELSGAFVTLTLNKQLRGCIGFTEPVYPLYEAIINAAQSAAFKDPRFPGLTKEEFEHIVIEVSVLSAPARVEVRNPEEYYSKIQIGKDGLMIIGTFSSGLLLPQVAVEYKWDVKTFLEQTCVKAGLQANSYLDFDNCRVYKFQSEVFSEQSPQGKIIQKM